MSLFTWCTRRSGGLAMIALVILCYYVISKEAATANYKPGLEGQERGSSPVSEPNPDGAGIWTVIFAWYCFLIHILISVFPLRASWAILELTRGIRRAGSWSADGFDFSSSHRRNSSTSLSSAETLETFDSSTTLSCSSSEAGDTHVEAYTDTDYVPRRVVHTVIIPNYKEEMDTLRETLDVLASHPQARDTYDICLAMEAREDQAETKALALVNEFVKKFRSIDFTMHPPNIPGECPGKGSNVDWAIHKMSEKYPFDTRKDVVVTGIDADSHLSSNYFLQVTSMHLAHPDTALTTMYVPPIIFDRNANNVPAPVRVADILWCAGGLSGMYRGSNITPPTSVYSVPLQLVDRVGGWDTNPEAIGEDLHMYIKCFFALNGNLTIQYVMSPVSQCNVTGGGYGKGLPGVGCDMRARHKQALRHMWGALDSGYAMNKFVELWRNRHHTSCHFRPLHCTLNRSMDEYGPNDRLDLLEGFSDAPDQAVYTDVVHCSLQKPNYKKIFYLFHRLFEAHFLPVQTTVAIVASTLLVWLTEDAPDIHGIAWIFDVCTYLRTAGFMGIAFYLVLYEKYHKLAVTGREREMKEAGLAKGMNFSHRTLRKNVIDYVMVPIVAPMFGAIPCAEAQTCHFWTVDLVYTVSRKVTRQRSKSTSDM